MTDQPTHPVNAAVCADSPEAVSPHLFQHRRFWLRLAAYRPLLVVGGFWIVLLAIALVAYGRLTDTGSQQRAESRAPYPHEQAQLGQDASQAPPAPISSATVEDPDIASAPETPAVAPSEPASVPIWSVGLLVALCAGGCLTLSQQLKPSRTAPRQPRRRQAVAPLKTAGPRKTASGSPQGTPKAAPKRMPPYRPGPGAADFASGFAAAAAVPRNKSPTVPVAVVPEGTTNSLDWPKDSLIHTMDVRQRRDVSSWLSS